MIPVAILTTSASDASTVDPLSVSFGPNSATETHRKGHLQDVDGDGDFDLLLHFAVRSTGIKTGDVSASLTGKTIAGRDIEGKDNIVTVDGNNKVAGEEGDAFASIESAAPDRFQLLENFPNPFNPQTMIRFSLPEDTKVTLKVFNVLGQEVARLVDGGLSAGMHQVAFDATRLPSGMYLYKLEAGTSTLTNRMLLIR